MSWVSVAILLLILSSYLATPGLHVLAQALVIILLVAFPVLFHQEWQELLSRQSTSDTNKNLPMVSRIGISLLIAVLLILVTLGSATRIGQVSQEIPITAVNLPTGMSAKVSGSQRVAVLVSAPRNDWAAISPEGFSAIVDVAGQSEGSYDLPVSISTKVSGVKILRITPERAFVTVEPIITKTVTIASKFSGKAGSDLVPGETTITPVKAEVSGPRSVVTDITQVFAPIVLNGETAPIKQTITLQAEYSSGEIISNLTFVPPEVEVDVPLVVPGKSKTVGIKPMLTGNPGSGFWVSSVIISPLTVAVTGSSDALAELSMVSTAPIDVSGLSNKVEQKVKLSLPAGITLAEAIDTISVTIEFNNTDTTKSLNPEIVYSGLSNSLKVTSLNPSSLTAIVSGAANTLSGVNGPQVKLNLDLSPYNSPGNYTVTITGSFFALPEGVGLVSFLPSAVNVTLETK